MVKARWKRSSQMLVGVAILFFVMGVGNMIFANVRLDSYREILTRANADLARSEAKPASRAFSSLRRSSRFFPGANVDKQSQHIARLQSRIEFYELVLLGGKLMLGFSGVLLLAGFLFTRGGQTEGIGAEA